jgi:hypothetical protein
MVISPYWDAYFQVPVKPPWPHNVTGADERNSKNKIPKMN